MSVTQPSSTMSKLLLTQKSRQFPVSNIFAVALSLRAALAGPVSCQVVSNHGIENFFTIDGVTCEGVWNTGTPACHVAFDNKITLHGSGNCEGTEYWVILPCRLPMNIQRI